MVSGGKAMPATLSYHEAARKLGVAGLGHLVSFDEVANTGCDDAEPRIGVLKDYMRTGKFSHVATPALRYQETRAAFAATA